MSRGFTLVEVVMALAVFGFVGLAAGVILEGAARAAREVESRERLLWIADTVLDSLRREAHWFPGEVVLPDGGRVLWRTNSSGGTVEAWPPDAARAMLSAPVGPPGTGGRDG